MLRVLVFSSFVAIAAMPRPASASADKTVEHIAPPFGCDTLSIPEGLPNTNVKAIVQDKRGFIWFGTQDGLARYDGIKMHVYRPAEKDPTSISSASIVALALDASGKLWVGTENGVSLYDPDKDSFTRFLKATGKAPGLSSDGINAIVRDRKDRIWLAMNTTGLNRIDAAGTIVDITKPVDVAITALDADAAGNLWLGTQNDGVIRWNPDDNKNKPFRPGSAAQITAVRAMSNGKIWIGTDGEGAFELDPATEKFTPHRHDANDPSTLSDDHIVVMFEDAHKVLWIGTKNGLNRVDGSGRILHYQHDAKDPNNHSNLSFPEVDSIYQDAGGVMWAGGFTGGVCKFNEARAKFGHHYMRTYAKSFFEDADGTLWVGTENGLYKYEWPAERVTVYHSFGQRIGGAGEPPVTLESAWIGAVHRDKRGTLWVAVWGQGLIAFDPKAETYRLFRPDPEQPDSLPVPDVWDIWEDEHGTLWLATANGGLVMFDGTDKFTAFTTDTTPDLTSNFIYTIFPDPKDTQVLWLGTAKGGVVRFNIGAKTATNFRQNPDDPTTLSSDDIAALYRDPAGTLWVGTFGGGLDRIDPMTGKGERFTTNNSGLTNDAVFGVLPDADGKLWLSTNGGGLLQFDPKTKKFVAYGPSDGVQDNEFSQVAALRTKSGQLIFGGVSGFNAFNPKDITPDPYVPPLVITAFKVFNQDLKLPHPIWTLPSVEVSYSDSFEVQFAALAFAAPKKNRYQYKLDGFDDKFIETDRPFASYTKLDGGTYTLRVKAANESGVWNETGVALKMTVTPPIWKTRRAYGVYILLLIGLAYLVYRLQRQRVRRAEREGRLAVVERDLQLTGAVQTGFLPEHNEINSPRFQLVGAYKPADACGGDWWWHEELAGGRHFVMVGDVSGHGPGPAMVTAAVATAFHVILENGLEDMSDGLELLNRVVLRVGKGKYHMTMAALELDEATGRWIFHSAGAPPILSLNQKGKHRVHFCAGAPLGTEVGFEIGRVEGKLEPTDRLLLYTDGIPEIMLPSGNVMGMRRFAQGYELTRRQGLKEAADSILLHADQVQGKQAQADDWTFAILEWG